VREVTPDELLAPEELRKREFERRIQDAIGKKQKKKKKKDGMVSLTNRKGSFILRETRPLPGPRLETEKRSILMHFLRTLNPKKTRKLPPFAPK
jgi:hypothetical protein